MHREHGQPLVTIPGSLEAPVCLQESTRPGLGLPLGRGSGTWASGDVWDWGGGPRIWKHLETRWRCVGGAEAGMRLAVVKL